MATKTILCPVCGGKGFVYWSNNTEITNSIGSITCLHCNGTGWREVPMTNADRIRAMNDEDLANIVQHCCPPIKRIAETCYEETHCVDCWVKWLQQPAEEE